MTATTQAAPETCREKSRHYHLGIFFFNAHLFRDLCQEMRVNYESSPDATFPIYNFFHFSAGEEFIMRLMQGLVKANCPFELANFDVDELPIDGVMP